MGPLGIGLIAGGMQAGGNLISDAINVIHDVNESQRNRNFQEYMSNTAIQRAVKDASDAGISPAMLFSNSAKMESTPSGSQARAGISPIGTAMASGVDSILKYIQRDRELDAKERQNDRYMDYLEDKNRNKEYIKQNKGAIENLFTKIEDLKL